MSAQQRSSQSSRQPLVPIQPYPIAQPVDQPSPALQNQLAYAQRAIDVQQWHENSQAVVPQSQAPPASPSHGSSPSPEPSPGKNKKRKAKKGAGGQGKKGKENASKKIKQSDQATAKSIATWQEDEERVMLNELGILREKGMLSGMGTHKEKHARVAKVLNKAFFSVNPAKYLHERTGQSCYDKWRNLKARYKKEVKLQRKWEAEHSVTGSATADDQWESKWVHFHDFYENCVQGNPANEQEQAGSGMIQRSALPGIEQDADDQGEGEGLEAPKGSPEHPYVTANKAARKQRKSAADTPASQNIQPDLVPRMSSRERHGNQVLRDAMQQMLEASKTDQLAADRRAAQSQQAMYEMMLYKTKQQQHMMRCQQQMQQNRSIETYNAQALHIWEKVGGDPPILKEPVFVDLNMPTPPKNPAERRAEAEVARQAEAAAAAAAEAAAEEARLAEAAVYRRLSFR